MCASLYFRDTADVRWRLEGTYLYIGKQIWYVAEVCSGLGNIAANARLFLTHIDSNNSRTVALRHLPVSALFNAPRGYIMASNGVLWGARGPTRDRFQGLTDQAIWYRNLDRQITVTGQFSITSPQLRSMAELGRTLKRKGWGWSSKEIALYQELVFYQGVPIGQANMSTKEVHLVAPMHRMFTEELERAGCHVKS